MLRNRPAAFAVLLLLTAGCAETPDRDETEAIKRGTRDVDAVVRKVLPRTGQAVITAGRLQGVVVGTSFAIYREKEFVGRLQVTTVWDNECGGRVVESRKPLAPGDQAVAAVAGDDSAAKAPPAEPARQPRQRPGTIQARLLSVRPKSMRVALSAGSKQGVKLGKVFYIYRGDEFAGRVRVTVVKPEMSGAEIVESRAPFAPGFRAVYDPEDERRDAGKAAVSAPDLDKMIRELEAKIADPKTKGEDRDAAREVLRRLRKQRRDKRGTK
jgi:hypothetical protein